VKIHRAITLAVMIAGSLLLLAVMLIGGVSQMGGQGLLALAIVLVVAAVAGIAFSWRRYFPSRKL
jgi:hypothetical protein